MEMHHHSSPGLSFWHLQTAISGLWMIFFLYCLMPSREKYLIQMQMISVSPLGRLEWALRSQTFWCFPAVFQRSFNSPNSLQKKPASLFAYFSSVVPHFNTDVLTFFLCHFLLPPTSALSVVFAANCSIGGRDMQSHCGWLACIKNLQSVWPTSKTNTTFSLFFFSFLKSFFHRFPPKCKNKYNPAVPCECLNLLFRRGGALIQVGLHIYCTVNSPSAGLCQISSNRCAESRRHDQKKIKNKKPEKKSRVTGEKQGKKAALIISRGDEARQDGAVK